MAILPVTGVTSAVAQTTAASQTGSTGGTQFADLLNDAINATDQAEDADTLSNMALLAGNDVDLHTTMIEAQKAELALTLTIQIRNKVVDAYNEVMRMQV